jgi:hypothetical protein
MLLLAGSRRRRSDEPESDPSNVTPLEPLQSDIDDQIRGGA